MVSSNDAARDDLASIKALEGRYSKAVNAKNLDAIMQVHIPDQSLHAFDLVPLRQYVGSAAYRKVWEGFFAAFP